MLFFLLINSLKIVSFFLVIWEIQKLLRATIGVFLNFHDLIWDQSWIHAGTSPSVSCSWWQERFWTCTIRLTWERSWACTSSRSSPACSCTAWSCCRSSSISSLVRIPFLTSEGCCRLSSSRWPHHPGKTAPLFGAGHVFHQMFVSRFPASSCPLP